MFGGGTRFSEALAVGAPGGTGRWRRARPDSNLRRIFRVVPDSKPKGASATKTARRSTRFVSPETAQPDFGSPSIALLT